MKHFDPSLYFVTDSTNYTEEEFLSRVEQALQGGVTLLQLREKEKSTREYLALAVPLMHDGRCVGALGLSAESGDNPEEEAQRLTKLLERCRREAERRLAFE